VVAPVVERQKGEHMKLTDTDLLSFIKSRRMVPTLKEAGRYFGVHHQAINYRLKKLEAAGLITREPGAARSILLTPMGERIAPERVALVVAHAMADRKFGARCDRPA
jgi:DNA-binding MarR family transcriptional regulator